METGYQTNIQNTENDLVFSAPPRGSEGWAFMAGQYPSSAERAYWILREMIITFDIAPGSVIRDADLTAKLGIGRTPIREAIKRLEVEKLVVSHHRKGTYVSEITLGDIKRQYQIHRQLLTLAVALASQSGDKSRKQLERRSHYLAANAATFSLEMTLQLLTDLELDLAQAGGNPFLRLTLQQYCGYAQRTCHLLKPILSAADLHLEHYPEIMALVVQKDSERASQLMAAHVDQVHLRTVDRFLELFV